MGRGSLIIPVLLFSASIPMITRILLNLERVVYYLVVVLAAASYEEPPRISLLDSGYSSLGSGFS